jgi:hypothetical protein
LNDVDDENNDDNDDDDDNCDYGKYNYCDGVDPKHTLP